MTNIARLRDCLRPEPPDRVLCCTYGFQPEFFEQEILPAIFPNELAFDRGAGNTASYLQAGDELLAKRPVVVCCDHHDAGRTLKYQLVRVPTGGGAFHAKLLLLDYGGDIRAVVSSANLTRHAWTSALELFVFDDLPRGDRHPWASALRRFLAHTRHLLGEASARQLDPFVERLADVKDPRRSTRAASRLVSTFDGPFLELLMEGHSFERAELVTPFLEGEAGSGVFDRLHQANPQMVGTLYVRAEEADGAPVVRGPREKLEALMASGRWQLRQVRRQWDGDAEDMPRQLHGKLVALANRDEVTVLVGSANVTRAALLMTPPAGNVELGVIFELRARELRRLLPQSDGVRPEEVTFAPAEAEDPANESIADWVDDAVYYSSTARLELRLKDGAPALEVLYRAERVGGELARPPIWSHTLRLASELEVMVRTDGSEAVIPFLILEAELAPPRGLSRRLRLDELLDILAGRREVSVDDRQDGDAPGDVGLTAGALRRAGEAFAWRKLMRALAGLERDLLAGIAFPSEVHRLLDGPLGAQALLDVLRELRASPAFQDADYAFAVHELREAVRRVRGRRRKREQRPSESLDHLDRWIESLAAEFAEIRKTADRTLRRQLDLLVQAS